MRVIKEAEVSSFVALLRKRASTSVKEDDVQKTVRKIILDVQKTGDRAVRKYTKKFDSVDLEDLAVCKREIALSAETVDGRFLAAMKKAAARIKKFHELQKEKSWQFSKEGITLGQVIRPLNRVGVYVPGGKAFYPSTVLMNVIPAQVAGVKEIALCVPTPSGTINPHVAAAIQLLAVDEVYRIGGAQAIAAFAFGTETIDRVDKIVGPGNIFVAAAKKMVFGNVGIDMVAGPSEILVIADSSGDPSFIASDLLSQAEHDEMASSVLITDSVVLAGNVKLELKRQIGNLKRKEIAGKSLRKYGAIIVVKNIKNAARISDSIAPEHLEIMTRKPADYARNIHNAGAIFLGKWTPEPLGDYAAGPNHTLPTGGTARFSSPLGVYDFIKRTSLLHASKKGFLQLSETVESFADTEGLEAHGKTVSVRKHS
ncbi:MAG: histidinol dehydrogenase [Nitrospiraceae bacterium]|nr:MAG: histidinol dehydrogenase [Nitrospiraceae bacterium]